MHKEALTPKDLPELLELQPEGWTDITPYFQFYFDSPFCHPIKIVEDNKMIGIGTNILHKSSAWIAHIIVHPEFRNRGIGGLVTKSLLDTIDTAKHPTISLIATPMGEPVYKKLGFQAEGDYLFFKNEKYKATPEENPNITLAEPAFYDEILAFDQMASGEDRSVLLEPHLKHIKIFRDQQSVQGFYAPSLGDGLVVAENETAGIALLKLRLQVLPFVVLPAENEAGIDFLQKEGFLQFQKGSRMQVGNKLDFKGKMLYNRIGGNLG